MNHEKDEKKSTSIHISGGTFGDGTVIGSDHFTNIIHKGAEKDQEFDMEQFRKLAEWLVRELRNLKEADTAVREEAADLVETVREQVEQGKPKRSIIGLLNEKLEAIGGFIAAESALAANISAFKDLLDLLMKSCG